MAEATRLGETASTVLFDPPGNTAEAKESYMVVGRGLRPASCRKWHARFREMERETEHDERPGRSNRLDSRQRESPPVIAIETAGEV